MSLLGDDYFEQIETISAQALSFVRYHSAMTQPNQSERSSPGPSIIELNCVLTQEQRKYDALIHIRDELLQFYQEQASAQRISRTAAFRTDDTSRDLSPLASKQSKIHKVSKRRTRGHAVSRFFCFSLVFLANFAPVFNWLNSRTGLFVVIVATFLKHRNGVVDRTALELFATHVVYIIQKCLDEWAILRRWIMRLAPSLKKESWTRNNMDRYHNEMGR